MKYLKYFEKIVNDIVIDCSCQNLYELPELPDTLEYLFCYHNNLTSLPELPNNLKELYCSNNKITELPILPEGLQYLSCEGNYLPYKDLKGYNEWLEITHPELFNVRKFNI